LCDLILSLLLPTFGGLAKVAILPLNFHTKHTLQIYEKLSYEALNRHFCQTAVMCCPSCLVVADSPFYWCLDVLAWWLFCFFLLVCEVGKKANVPPKALANDGTH
jgi:hypothetical protein